MDNINILSKLGFLTDDDRKSTLTHGCENFMFKTCLDLSDPIQVIPYSGRQQFTLQEYSQDVSSFICWWTNFILKDLNGFSGFTNLEFVLVDFTII